MCREKFNVVELGIDGRIILKLVTDKYGHGYGLD